MTQAEKLKCRKAGDRVVDDRAGSLWAGATYHDEFARCPECGNATVGTRRPWGINHAAGCSMPAEQIEREIAQARLLAEFDRALSDVETAYRRATVAGVGLVNLGVDIGRHRDMRRYQAVGRAIDATNVKR